MNYKLNRNGNPSQITLFSYFNANLLNKVSRS